MSTADDTTTTTTTAGRGLRSARAAELARAGHRDEALRLLGRVDAPSAAELDLMARIQAQRGRFAEADDLWARATGLSGADVDGYRKQRARVGALRDRGARSGRRRGVLVAAVALVVLVALVVGLIVWRLTRESAAVEELAGARAEQAETVRQLDAARQAPPAAPARPELPPDLAPQLSGPGLDVLTRPEGGLLVRFAEAPFAVEGAELSPAARAGLESVGRALAPLVGRVDVRVVGHAVAAADASPADPGGANTGLARAIAAQQVLLVSSGLPADDVDATSAGGADPPFPTTGPDQGARNRTVTVLVTPRP